MADSVKPRSITTASVEDGAVTAAQIGGVLYASQIPNLDASTITSGTLAEARLSANVALLNANQAFTDSNRFAGVVAVTNVANTFVGAFTDNGAGLTSLDATGLTGTVPDARLSSNVALRSGGNTFSGNQLVSSGNVGLGTLGPQRRLDVAVQGTADGIRVDGVGTAAPSLQLSTNGTSVGEFGAAAADGQYSGDARPGDFVIRASAGKLLRQNSSGSTALVLTNTLVGIRKINPATALDVNGTVTATSFAGDGSGLTNVVLLNTNQAFTGSNRFAGVVTATNVANTFVGSFTGNGGGLTNLDASDLATGTVPLARLPSGVVTNNATAVALTGAFSGDGSGLEKLNLNHASGDTLNIGRDWGMAPCKCMARR